MARLRCDDNPGTAAGNDVAELFQHKRRAVEIDFDLRMVSGEAWVGETPAA
jgi:hypothetical protein